MPAKEYERRLDTTGAEWLRVRFTTERGQLTIFTVQYETTVEAQTWPVIRYDSAHGFAHVDVLAPDGSQVSKRPLPDHLTLDQAFQLGITDIVQNWKTYRERFWEAGNDDSTRARSR